MNTERLTAPEPAGGWKTMGIVMSAPKPDEVARFCMFVRETLAVAGVDLLVLLVRYAYQFKTHPECAEPDALSCANVKAIKSVCDECGIRLVPKMNLLGHQGGKSVVQSGLLHAHPELDESPDKQEVRYNYCRSICTTHPDALRYVTDLAGEMASAFDADLMHIGCDEVFEIGHCERCRGIPASRLFAEWVNAIARHLKARGVKTMIWADRLLNADASGYGVWEASDNGTDGALGLLDKDVILCDWHYESRGKYPSVETFADAGFQMYLCPWRYAENTRKFLDYAVQHDCGRYLGVLLTTWYPARDVMDAFEGRWAAPDGKDPKATTAATLYALARNFRYLFPKAKADWQWYDGSELPIEGKGWTGRDQTESYYDRLPVAHADAIPAAVWELQKHTAGLCFRFKTASSTLRLSWKPRFPGLSMWHMPSSGVSGVDMYQWTEARGWQFVVPPWPAPPKAEGAAYTWTVVPNAPVQIHLPLYNGIEYFRLGIEPGTTIDALPPRRSGITKPVVFYGTSTTQGGCVSRPGLCWPTIAARLADVPQVNLGFSGSGKMEDIMLDCVAELDASVYVLDTVGNMNLALLNERFEKFLRALAARRPGVPVVMTVHPWDDGAGQTDRQNFIRALYAGLKTEEPEQWKNLYFLGDEPDLHADDENTVEGSHLNDVGALRMGTICANLLKAILAVEQPCTRAFRPE